MEKMIVFELISKNAENKKVFSANYRKEDERLFPVNFAEVSVIEDDVVIHITTKTQIRRYTESGFVMEQFHWGDQVILVADGNWECRHSLRGYGVALYNRLNLWARELIFKVKKALKDDNLGMVHRKVQQNTSFIDFYVDID